MKELLEEFRSLRVEVFPRLALLVAQFNVLEVQPVAHKMLHRVFARAKQVGDGRVDHDAEHQAGAFDSRPQLLDVVEAILFGAGEVAVDTGVREVRG